jgi:dTDP-4-amino-4,6-dideoxygalactose transaminase
MVPLLDPTRQYQNLKRELDAAVIALLSSGQYVLGPAVESFERAAAGVLGVRHAVGVANGTDALQIALQAHGVGPGDEVIVPPFTFIATAEVVSLLGATPVFCDIETDTFNLDPAQIEAKINDRTKAIIPVHLFGHPAPMEAINAIAEKHGVLVLEDAAQAWGAKLKSEGRSQKAEVEPITGNRQPATGNWKHCGALGDIAGFSFYPTKNLGACGEGGLITTDDDTLAEKCKMLRVHGQSRRYIHDEIGYNSRLHALQAAILNVKLPHAQKWNEARRKHAAHYNSLLEKLPLQLPVERAGAYHVYHQYTLRVPDEKLREKICESLTAQQIAWAIYYPVALHLQPVYESLNYREGDLPVVERAAKEVLSLPIFPELRDDEVEQVGRAVKSAVENA